MARRPDPIRVVEECPPGPAALLAAILLVLRPVWRREREAQKPTTDTTAAQKAA